MSKPNEYIEINLKIEKQTYSDIRHLSMFKSMGESADMISLSWGKISNAIERGEDTVSLCLKEYKREDTDPMLPNMEPT